MTLNDIISSALKQLGLSDDSQTVASYRENLTAYINGAIADIARSLNLRRTESVTLADGCFNLRDLSHQCVKIYDIVQGGKNVKWEEKGQGDIGIGTVGDITVMYAYLPDTVISLNDVPDLPAYTHMLLTYYAIAMDRSSSDATTQRGASVYFEMYNAGKAALTSHAGSADKYKIIARY